MLITVKPDQSLFDIAVQYCGLADQAFAIARANGLSLTEDLFDGQTIDIPDDLATADEVVQYFADNGLVVATDYTFPGEYRDDELFAKLIQLNNEINGADGYIGIQVTGGTKPYTYSWTDSDGVEVSTSQNLNGAVAGEYTVLVTDADNNQVSLTALIVSIGDNNVYLVDEFGNFITDENGQPIIA